MLCHVMFLFADSFYTVLCNVIYHVISYHVLRAGRGAVAHELLLCVVALDELAVVVEHLRVRLNDKLLERFPRGEQVLLQ